MATLGDAEGPVMNLGESLAIPISLRPARDVRVDREIVVGVEPLDISGVDLVVEMPGLKEFSPVAIDGVVS